MTPDCIERLYITPPAPATAQPNNSLGIFEVGDEFSEYSFYKVSTGEALDVDMAYPIAHPQIITLFQVHYCQSTDKGKQCGGLAATNVMSFSHGDDEVKEQLKKAKVSLRRHSMCSVYNLPPSFGHSGVNGIRFDGCLGKNKDIFNPNDRTGCSSTLAVGGTSLVREGFSNIFPTADYHKDAVNEWFAEHDPGFPTYNNRRQDPLYGLDVCNRIGRGYPDVAAAATNGEVCILKNPSMFTDVTVGAMSAKYGGCNNTAFDAGQRGDPVTGLGSPNYPEMSRLLPACLNPVVTHQ
ncbi:hypothetical protein NLG97_g5771 [Lecanicillium saksenae]|uniref:Uncharacterized protein n=1 Tax=Lecanicillium saksenae TaxID=468837 RepID=A0ACC1QS29_9HYPO|nr:hypothetical protein NLG97_g5771 [Lecanicillium saksenae]